MDKPFLQTLNLYRSKSALANQSESGTGSGLCKPGAGHPRDGKQDAG